MRVLALDTTTRAGSVAILDDGRAIGEASGDGRRTHAERLPCEIIALLDAHGWTLADVELFAIASGPGSFTGLRIGIATIQGLALVNKRRVAAVSALDALAHAGSSGLAPRARVAAWMDAHRREVFAALYEVTEAAPLTVERLRIVQEPSAGDPREVLSRWSAPPDVVVGDGASLYADLLRGTTRAVSVLAAPPLAVTIAHLAVSLFLRGESVDPGGVQPLYVRRPDVEVERDRKGQQ